MLVGVNYMSHKKYETEINKKTKIQLSIAVFVTLTLLTAVSIYYQQSSETQVKLDVTIEKLSYIQNELIGHSGDKELHQSYKETFETFFTRSEAKDMKEDVKEIQYNINQINRKLDVLIAINTDIIIAGRND